jgi:hypothetical protein
MSAPAGYLIALDDYVSNDLRQPLAEMADILKVDWKLTTLEERAALVKKNIWRCRMPAGNSSSPAIRALFAFTAAFSDVRKS